MRKISIAVVALTLALATTAAWAMPFVFPTGTTTYKPDKAWNGYTVYPAAGGEGCVVVDMNGNVVKFWKGLLGEPGPNKLLPGGFVYGALAQRKGIQDYIDLSLVNWDGKVVWQFTKGEKVKLSNGTEKWMARQHHDFQIEGNPVGYYAPGMDFNKDGKLLILSHTNIVNHKISDKEIMDDRFIEINHDGKILWEWKASDGFDQFGFSKAAKASIRKNPNLKYGADWLHINSLSYVGPNQWYDKGDKRFAPDNIIFDSREANFIAILDKKTKKIVWKIGPDFSTSPELRKIGPTMGQHHAHIIPKGLPGAGDLLVFDNGGASGYGKADPLHPSGGDVQVRGFSRVLEINPVTLAIVWELDARKLGYCAGEELDKFRSGYISSAQRLPNGNTLVCEGSNGHIFEVTPTYEIVWDYVSPYFANAPKSDHKTWNMVYRAYRVPYGWIPQLPKPAEHAVTPPNNWEFSVPGGKWTVESGAVTPVKDPNQTQAKTAGAATDDDGPNFKAY